MSDSLQNHEPEHGRLPCTSLSPWVYSKLCPLSQCCHPIISFSVAPFSSYPQCFNSGCINLHSYQTVSKISLSSTPSLAVIVCRFFDDGHSDQCKVIPNVVFFFLISIIISDFDHLCMCLNKKRIQLSIDWCMCGKKLLKNVERTTEPIVEIHTWVSWGVRNTSCFQQPYWKI